MRHRSYRLPVFVTGALLGLLLVPGSVSAQVHPWVITQDTVMTGNHIGPVSIGADNITLDCAGFTIDATGTGWSAIDIHTKSGVTVKNCTVTSDVFGIAGNYTTGLVLEANTALNNGAAGLGTGYATDTTILGNVASGNDHGFQLHGSETTLIGNTATGNTHYGFNELGAASYYEGNTASGNRFGFVAGPHVGYTPADHELVANTATGNTEGGFLLRATTGLVMTGNTASGNTHGFALSGSTSRLIGNNAIGNLVNGFDDRGTGSYYEGNTANGNAHGFAIYMIDPSPPMDATLIDNTATRNTGSGFNIAYEYPGTTVSMNANLVDNTANRNPLGIVIRDARNVTLTSNQTAQNDIGVLVQRSEDVTLESNNIVWNNDSGAKLVGVEGGSVVDNRFLRNTYAGIQVWDSTHVTVDSNTVMGNGGRALLLVFGGHHLVTENVVRNNGYNNDSEGVGVSGSSNNLILGNRSDHNTTHGFLAYPDFSDPNNPVPAEDNTFQENSACRNGLEDGYDQDTDSTWINNDFCTTYNIP